MLATRGLEYIKVAESYVVPVAVPGHLDWVVTLLDEVP